MRFPDLADAPGPFAAAEVGEPEAAAAAERDGGEVQDADRSVEEGVQQYNASHRADTPVCQARTQAESA